MIDKQHPFYINVNNALAKEPLLKLTQKIAHPPELIDSCFYLPKAPAGWVSNSPAEEQAQLIRDPSRRESIRARPVSNWTLKLNKKYHISRYITNQSINVFIRARSYLGFLLDKRRQREIA